VGRWKGAKVQRWKGERGLRPRVDWRAGASGGEKVQRYIKLNSHTHKLCGNNLLYLYNNIIMLF
jgi:hypothetical protein